MQTYLNYKTLFIIILFHLTIPHYSWGILDSLTTVIINDQDYILHYTEPGQTLYSLSKRYNITIENILLFNPSARDSVIFPGEILKIPTVINKTEKTDSFTNIIAPKYHVVSLGETLYKIKQQYQVSLDSLRAWNGKSADTIRPGQQLVVGWDTTIRYLFFENISEVSMLDSSLLYGREDSLNLGASNPYETSTLINDSLNYFLNAIKPYRDKYKKMELDSSMIPKRQRGIATWVENNGDGAKGFFALHSGFERGDIIKVRSLMNDEEIYVKVIGKLPDTEENKKVLVKVSYDTAKYLGVLDARFLAEINYFVKKK